MILGKVGQVFHSDKDGNPAGGFSSAPGTTIVWQHGPGEHQTGAIVEQIIQIAIGRLEYYQGTKFECEENANAITHLTKAIEYIQSRTQSRIDRGVEGTYEK